MASYRFYFQNAEGHFVRARNVDAASDDEALARARDHDHGHGIEVWQEKRRVGLVEP